jgi:beta-lactamase regulating signal transducer with metallopeptidase domain
MEFLSKFVWLDLLSGYLIKSTLVLSFAIILVFLCRKQPASLRHFILSISLVGLLIFPILSTFQTGWNTGLLPSWAGESKLFATVDIAMTNQSGNPNTIETDHGKEDSQFHGNLAPIESKWAGFSETALWNLLRYSLIVIWFFGLSFALARQIFGLYGAYKLTKESDDVKSPFWRHLLNRFLEAISIKKKVHLLQHKKVKVPLTWGWLKPVVIMPDESNFWTSEQRESALYHELSHVKRADFLVMMLARLSLGLYWFNPLSWIVFQKMKKEQEKACDELVLKTGIKPSTYAANLLSIRNSMQIPWNPPAAVLGALGRSQLNDRLLTILKRKCNLKEVKMKTKIFFSVLVILTITFLGMARPGTSNNIASEASMVNDVFVSENFNQSSADQEEQEKKKEKEKTEKAEKKESEEKKKDVFVWHMDEGEEGEVEVIITDKGKVKSFTIKEPVIIIKKDDSGKEIAITTKGEAVDIKKGEEGTWVIKSDALSLHENMEAIDLNEGYVITLKTRTKDGHKTIEINAPAVVVKKIKHSSPEHISVKVIEEKGKKKAIFVAPHVNVEHHPDVQLQVKETELKKIHEKLEKIHEKLSKKMESKTEEEEQALKDMEETLKKLEKKLDAMEDKMKNIALTIHEEPHKKHLDYDHAISFKHKTDPEEGEEEHIYITKDAGQVMAFVDEEGEATFLAHMKLEKAQKQAFTDAVEEVEQDLPDGYSIESEFDDESGKATIKIKGSEINKDKKDVVVKLLKGLKEKLSPKN